MLFQASLSPQREQQGAGAESAFTDTPSAPAATVCDIEIISTRARFDALETEWNGLFERAARADQLFQSFNWLWHWANHFLDDATSLRIIAGWSEGRLAMVWPLVETKTFGLKKLIWMGEPVSQYGGALIEPGAFAQDMLNQGWKQAGNLGADFALLRKTPAASPAGLVIADATACVTATAPVLDFGAAKSFDEVFSRLSAKARSSRRRLRRRLLERGDIRFSSPVQKDPPERLIRDAFELKRTWLLRRGRYSPAIENDATLGFFIDAASSRDRPVPMPIDAIYCGDRPIGIAISLLCGDEMFGHIIAHDGDFEKQGIGVILTEHVLKSSFERGSARFDMLAPQDAYKMEWTDKVSLVHDWIKPFSLAGRLYAAFYISGLPQMILRALKTLPSPAGRVIWPMIRRLKKALQRS
jgi:CelD/BcsL family acetyltransferase involved in cellulose biosynthesis